MEVRDKIFSEQNMCKRLKKAAKDENLINLDRAIDYAMDKHGTAFRKMNKFKKEVQVPYINHPLMMACHAHALGIKDDTVLTVAMLHDVCEDCGVEPEDLPFPEEVRECVRLLTKNKKRSTADYYGDIAKNPTAAIVKALDRVNNVSTMSNAFSEEKLAQYLMETESYVYPLLDLIKHEYEDYNDAVFILKYHLISLVETIKCLILESKKEEGQTEDAY